MSDNPAPTQISMTEVINKALSHHQAGRLAEAEALYEKILAADRNNPDALHLAGVVAMQTGRNELAIKRIANAIQVRPEFTEAYNNLGNALKNLDRLGDAILSYRKAIELNPQLAEAHNNLGGALQGLGDLTAALVAYEAALAIRPDYLHALRNKGNIYRDLGDYEAAIKTYESALSIDPNAADVCADYAQLYNMQGDDEQALLFSEKALECNPDHAGALNSKGLALAGLGRALDAIACFQTAIKEAPAYAIAYNNIGNSWRSLKDFSQALGCYEIAVGIDPQSADFICNQAMALQDLGRTAEAIVTFQKAREIDPNSGTVLVHMASLKSRHGDVEAAIADMDAALELEPENTGWRMRSAFLLPVVAREKGDHLKYRQRMSLAIEQMDADHLCLHDPYNEVGTTNFRISYDDINNRGLAQRISELYLKLCPALGFIAEHCKQKPEFSKTKLKIGFVSAHLKAHTIGKLNAGIIAHFSRSAFEVVVVRSPGNEDALAAQINATADSILTLTGHLDGDRQRIADQEFDVLFYLDIGLDPYMYFLSFSRLAPVQAVTWGHPDTTGIPNMDYFVSSRHMEPEAADTHYSEALVMLDHMPTVYRMPLPPEQPFHRSDFGFQDDVNLYVCPQTLFKFHPDFDETLRKLLMRDVTGRLVLIADPSPEPWRHILSERLRSTLGDCFEQVIFLPFMSEPKYLGLLSISDVIIDIPTFSGGNSTLEAFAMGAPVVTWPGEFMRGCVTTGYYRQMDMEDLIVTSEADYLDRVYQLANDPDYRREMIEKIVSNRPKVFEQTAVVREMEVFFESAYESWRTS